MNPELRAKVEKIIEAEIGTKLSQLKDVNQNEMHALVQDALKRAGASETPEYEHKGQGFSRFVKSLVMARGNPSMASDVATKHFKDDYVSKALQASGMESGGVLVPEQLSSDIIELLRPRSVIRSRDPVILPMETGVLPLPKQTGGASSGYVGESQSRNASQPNFGQVRLVWRKLKTVVPLSNELISYSTPQADMVVRDDIVASMGTREDLAFIRDDGTESKPRGLLHWAPDGQKFNSNGSSLANVESDLRTMINNLQQNNVRMLRPGWLMNPRSAGHLADLRDAAGNLAFPSMRDVQNPMLWQMPVGVTTNIPANLGTGSNESEIYLVDFADAVIGESNQLMIEVSNEATYTDASGNLASAFDRDETVIKAIARHDFVMRHAESVSVMQQVTWGT